MSEKILFFYFIAISIVAVIVTVYDKCAAIYGRYRISEKCLLLVSLSGGSLSMFLTMMFIRHKTQKPKFMVLIPLMILVHCALVLFVLIKI